MCLDRPRQCVGSLGGTKRFPVTVIYIFIYLHLFIYLAVCNVKETCEHCSVGYI